MQPAQARRGTSLVAGSSLVVGLTLVILALVLTACSGGSSKARSSSSASPSSSTTSPSPSPTGASAATTPAGSTPAPASPAPPTSVAPGAGDLPVQPPVSIASPATFAAGITSTVITIEPVDATAALPGEIAGPAVRLTLAVQNASGAAVDLSNVTVDLQDAAGASATSLTGNGAAPFTGSVPPGGSATGTYVFSLAKDDRTGVRIYVTCNAALPVVVFTGTLS